MNWIISNKEWIFSGIGLAVIAFMGKVAQRYFSSPSDSYVTNNSQHIVINNQNRIVSESEIVNEASMIPKNVPISKSSVSILFVDDDTRFKVVDILIKNGWTNTKIIKDITSLDQPDVVNADIFFIDYQGVGKALQFRDQGLGLVVALKKQYPDKKVVIYSAERVDAFHSATKVADDRISKDADPYAFMQLIDQLTQPQ